MKTKHTKGPWEITKDMCAIIGSDGGTLVIETTLAYWDNLAATSAQGSYAKNIADRMMPEVRANARLIAAAPDLLEACITAMPALDALILRLRTEDMESGRIVAECTRNMLIAAISKAKGEQ